MISWWRVMQPDKVFPPKEADRSRKSSADFTPLINRHALRVPAKWEVKATEWPLGEGRYC